MSSSDSSCHLFTLSGKRPGGGGERLYPGHWLLHSEQSELQYNINTCFLYFLVVLIRPLLSSLHLVREEALKGGGLYITQSWKTMLYLLLPIPRCPHQTPPVVSPPCQGRGSEGGGGGWIIYNSVMENNVNTCFLQFLIILIRPLLSPLHLVGEEALNLQPELPVDQRLRFRGPSRPVRDASTTHWAGKAGVFHVLFKSRDSIVCVCTAWSPAPPVYTCILDTCSPPTSTPYWTVDFVFTFQKCILHSVQRKDIHVFSIQITITDWNKNC